MALAAGASFSSPEDSLMTLKNSTTCIEDWRCDRDGVRDIVTEFLCRVGYDFSWLPADSTHVVDGLSEFIDALSPPIPGDFVKTFNKSKAVAARLAVSFYPMIPAELQIRVAISVMLIVTIDDVLGQCREDLGLFQRRFIMGEPQGNSLLEHFDNFLRQWQTNGAYGPYLTSMMVASSLDFIGGCYLESCDCLSQIPLRAMTFPNFLRSKTGYSEFFVHWVFPDCLFPEEKYLKRYIFAVPELISFTDYVSTQIHPSPVPC